MLRQHGTEHSCAPARKAVPGPRAGGDTTDDDLDGSDFVCPSDVSICDSYEVAHGQGIEGGRIFHRYDVGWFLGLVRSHSQTTSKFQVKYDDRSKPIPQALVDDDYGPKGHWVLVKI